MVREVAPFSLHDLGLRRSPEEARQIPAPTHVDGTGRLQTVTSEANPRYWRLISAFDDPRRAHGPEYVLQRQRAHRLPPGEALDCFLRTQMDALVLGDFLIGKKSEPTLTFPSLFY